MHVVDSVMTQSAGTVPTPVPHTLTVDPKHPAGGRASAPQTDTKGTSNPTARTLALVADTFVTPATGRTAVGTELENGDDWLG